MNKNDKAAAYLRHQGHVARAILDGVWVAVWSQDLSDTTSLRIHDDEVEEYARAYDADPQPDA